MNDQIFYWMLLLPLVMFLLGLGQLWIALRTEGHSPGEEDAEIDSEGGEEDYEIWVCYTRDPEKKKIKLRKPNPNDSDEKPEIVEIVKNL